MVLVSLETANSEYSHTWILYCARLAPGWLRRRCHPSMSSSSRTCSDFGSVMDSLSRRDTGRQRVVYVCIGTPRDPSKTGAWIRGNLVRTTNQVPGWVAFQVHRTSLRIVGGILPLPSERMGAWYVLHCGSLVAIGCVDVDPAFRHSTNHVFARRLRNP